ncbi:hypothetical protein AVEN_27805-1 [Araneus ventricosus]|uniref:Mos1 transposase HTH domain-containing protein n=1 Tax=Araneus ventricosus TaxID=182803 RepID=A0A4Y2EJ54_ARAVE|nr:hypothetical protein AVEN_27805-1 [Araneus ventricosus]
MSLSKPTHQLELNCRTLNIASMIDSPAKCELRSVIRFLQAEGNIAGAIHRRISRVYGANVLSDGGAREWCGKSKDSRTDVHDKDGHGCKSVGVNTLFNELTKSLKRETEVTLNFLGI